MRQFNFVGFAHRLLAMVCLLAASDCFDSGVTWLPDSSGFVYTGCTSDTTTQVRHYDLTTRKLRVVVSDTKAPTLWPAVSPDGKQIAVARVRYFLDEKSHSIQIIRYDLNGKELHRSPAFPWHTVDFKGSVGTTSLFWSPQGDRLIVTDANEQIPRGTAIYDLANERLTPLMGHFLVVGSTPFRRDGKLFLMWNYEGISLVTVDGKEERIGTLEKEKSPILRLDRDALRRWDGDTALIAGATAELRIDTLKRAVTFTDVMPPRKTSADCLIDAEYAFPNGGAVIRALRDGSVEALKPGVKQPHVVSKSGPHLFLPSPDQKWLVLRGMNRGAKILVIDRRGELVAELASQ